MQTKYYLLFKLKKLCLSLFCIMFILGANLVYAQKSGNISGIVTDKKTGEPLPGANVFLEGTSLGAATSVNGQYAIRQVPPGDYNMMVKYIGYKEEKLAITVKSGATTEINVGLNYVTIESKTVTVTAQAEGQIQAINQQLASNTITNVVSSDRIQEIPDANAAESVSHLPGISIIRSGGEGQKVTIRGLAPKYNVMMVNGVRMQSTDRDDRSVDLNMIAPNILSGIEVTKALTADMDADAVGGTVNLKIGKAQEGFHSKVAAQGGYGSLANTYGNYRFNGLFSDRFLDNKFGVELSGFADKYNRNSDVLGAAWNINRSTVTEQGSNLLLSELTDAIITDRVTDRKRAGGGLVLDYKLPFGSLLLDNFISSLNENQVELNNSLFTNGGFSAYTTINQFDNTVYNNALQGEFEFFNIGMDFSLSNSVSKQHQPGNVTMNLGTEQGQTGTIIPQGFNAKLAEPSVFLNAVSVPDNLLRAQSFTSLEREVSAIAREASLNLKIPYNFTNYLSGTLKFGGKYSFNTRNNNETQWYNNPDRNHIGELFVQELMDSLWTDLGLAPEDKNLGIRATLFEDPNYDVGNFLAGKEGINHFFYKADIAKMNKFISLARSSTVSELGVTYPAFLIQDQPSSQYDYNYSRDFSAFYIQTELNIGKYITLYPGVRYEKFNVGYTAYYTNRYGPNDFDFRTIKLDVDTIHAIKGENWFPQVQLRIKPLDWLDIRLASTKSIIYPDYRAVSPYAYLNNNGSTPYLAIGNPYLEPAISHNYDIYASVYDNRIGLFTAGFFYKAVDNLIVASSFRTRNSADIHNMIQLTNTQDTQVDTWINLNNKSFIRGFELDWQTHFWYLPSFLTGIVFSINYTHIYSKTYYPFQTAVKLGTGPFAKTVFVDSSRSGRMVDQPNDILNATLGYDIGDFSARLSFVYQNNVLITANRTWEELDAYTDASYRWDFTAYQKMPWLEALQVYLNINNITNQPDRHFISVLKKLDSVEYYGMTTDLGLRYSF